MMRNTGQASESKASSEPTYDENGFHIKDRDDQKYTFKLPDEPSVINEHTMRSFYSQKPAPIRVVRQQTTPMALHETIEEQAEGEDGDAVPSLPQEGAEEQKPVQEVVVVVEPATTPHKQQYPTDSEQRRLDQTE